MKRSSWLGRDTTVAQTFERRAARAEQLASAADTSPSSTAVLRFAAGLYRAQAGVAEALAGPADRAELAGMLERDLPSFAASLEAVVRYAGQHGPPGLRAAVDAYRSAGAGSSHAPLLAWWRGSRSGRTDYLARALLRPYAETLAARALAIEPLQHASAAGNARGVNATCPSCSARPWIAWRRAGAGDEAPARFLGCAVCGRERPLGRIECASCGESAPDKLAVFQTERHPAVRLEACDSCQRYVKSIDLSLDGLAIPEIDDLCSLSMDLWAAEQGYERLEPSLAGV